MSNPADIDSGCASVSGGVVVAAPEYFSQAELKAFWRLVSVAYRDNKVAKFLVAWREAAFWGEFNFSYLREIDRQSAMDIADLFRFICLSGKLPGDLHSVFDERIKEIGDLWNPFRQTGCVSGSTVCRREGMAV